MSNYYTIAQIETEILKRLTDEALEFIVGQTDDKISFEQVKDLWYKKYPDKSMFLSGYL